MTTDTQAPRTKPRALTRHLLAAGLLGGLLLAAVPPALAQMSSATVRGTITAAGAKAPAGTDVLAINKANGNTYRTKTLGDGSYVFPSLQPGSYEIRVGGGTSGSTISVSVGENATLDLASGSNQLETVVVTGNAQRQGVIDSQVGMSVSNRMIEAIPQATRNFLSAADFAPGVRFDTDSSGNTRLRGGSQNIDAVNVFIDGVGHKNNILRGGVVGQDTSQGNPFPQTAIAEYRVLTQNYKAEFDQVSSVAIAAVTKSGTNETHGNVYVNRTGSNWTSLSPVQEQDKANGIPPPSYKQIEAGFSLGGAIKQDVLHYFVAYDNKSIEKPRQLTIGPDTLTSAHYPGLPGVSQAILDQQGSFKGQFKEHLLFGKLSAEIDDSQKLDLSMTLRKETSYSVDGDRFAPSTAINNNNNEYRIDLSHELTRGPWLNEARIGAENSKWNPQSDSTDPQVRYKYSPSNSLNNVQDIFFTGGSPNSQDRRQKGIYLKDDLTFTGVAGHVVKGGVQLKAMKYELSGTAFRVATINTVLDSVTGQPYFSGLTCTGTNISNNGLKSDQCEIQPAIPSASANFKNKQYGIYLQDDWKLTKQLELNLGARWDYEDNMLNNDYVTPADRVAALRGIDGRTINGIVAPAGQTYAQSLAKGGVNIEDYISDGSSRKPFKGALAPRLGASYDVLGDKATVIYGGWGRSYDRRMANNALDELQKNAQAGGEIWMIRNKFKMPFADQMSIGLRQALGSWNMDVALSNIHAKNQFIWFGGNRDPNGGWGTQSPIDPLWGGPNGYGTLVLGDFVGENKASSLFLSLEKPYTQASGWSMTVAFTHTNARTTNNDWSDGIFDWTYGKTTHTFHPTLDAEKNRLVVGGLTDRLPWGLQLSGKLTLGSGQPRKVTDCHLGFANDTTAGSCVNVERDSENFKQFDMAIAKNFKSLGGEFQVRLDVLNLFNTANWGFYDDWVGGPSTPPANALGGDNAHFDTKTGVRGPMRQFKLGLSYTF
ncbi:TonB-dependent receptor domain-containing protein [Pelomonas sp. KK5]|uniref:TonB-dependent receptor n=1 Tax=Pelomonas sp. KK5 TaxID=1855730 RepID=UPI00097BA9C5|nr:TonB-dependent receptor [Pelomonas sp. KK5]